MQYAVDEQGNRVLAQRGCIARCPGCHSTLTPEAGKIVIPHWAHRGSRDCDPWYEPETRWHRAWKSIVLPRFTEVVYGASEKHRADIVTGEDTVIELQHSSITAEEAIERNTFYGRYRQLVWLFDARPFAKNVNFRHEEGNKYSFWWRHARKTHKAILPGARIIWDFGTPVLFEVDGFQQRDSRMGFGRVRSRLSVVLEMGDAIDPLVLADRLSDLKPALEFRQMHTNKRPDSRYFGDKILCSVRQYDDDRLAMDALLDELSAFEMNLHELDENPSGEPVYVPKQEPSWRNRDFPLSR